MDERVAQERPRRERYQDKNHSAEDMLFERKRERTRKRDETHEKDTYQGVHI